MKLLSLVAAATTLATSVVAQTPPNYTWAQSNQTLYLKFTGFPIFKGGAVLPYAEPTYQPFVYAPAPLVGEYIVFLVDADANKTAPVPSKLLWLDSGVVFANHSAYNRGAIDTPIYTAMSGNSSRVPYLAPSIPGHTYIAFLYESPPNFYFPPNFPYNATFRDGFNVTRIGADFKKPLAAANYFTIAPNATASASGTGYNPRPTGWEPERKHVFGHPYRHW